MPTLDANSCSFVSTMLTLSKSKLGSMIKKDDQIGSLLLGGKNDAPSRRSTSTTAIPANTPNSDAACRNCRDPERTVNLRIIGDDSIGKIMKLYIICLRYARKWAFAFGFCELAPYIKRAAGCKINSVFSTL